MTLTNTNLKVICKSLPEDDPLQGQPDITRAREFLGWEPKVSREDGMKVTYDYFKSITQEKLLKVSIRISQSTEDANNI